MIEHSKPEKLTLSKCLASAKQFATEISWCKYDNKIYLFAKENDWISECNKHMINIEWQTEENKNLLQVNN